MAGAAASVLLLRFAVPDAPAEVRTGLIATICTVVPYGLVGSVLIARRPDLPFGWLLTGAAAAQALMIACVAPAWLAVSHGHYGRIEQAGLLMGSLGFLPIGVQGLINVRFPSGRASGRRGRVLEALLWSGLAATLVGGFLGTRTIGALTDALPGDAAGQAPGPLLGGTVGAVADALVLAAPFVVLLGLVAGIDIVVRCWRATGIERQQLKWRAFGVVAALLLFPMAVTERLSPVVDNLDSTLFVATLAVPVLRYRLWEIDTIIRRSAVYAAVTALLVGCYVGITVLVADLASARVAAPVAAAGVALAVLPARNLSQRLVDRLFYGHRSDPYQALSEVAQQLEGVAVAGDVLPAVVRRVAESLRLPYVAIRRPGDGIVLAACGEPGENLEGWPLTYRGEPVGTLVAAPRRGEPAFDERDRQVLADIARQAGPAVRAEALTVDLLQSRQRLVTAREEDRRRMRRDLHDGLGPMLTGLGLNLDAARRRLAIAEPGQADEYLGRARDAAAQVISDLREMVYELRPPALDELGLLGAIRLHAQRLAAGADLEVEVGVVDPDDLDRLTELPAAVEVAAFRTAVEGVTNALRHARAGRCYVRLGIDKLGDPSGAGPGAVLVLTVTDDGAATGEWRSGVGLTAMRERVSELGGTLEAGPAASGGGHVLARYPLPPVTPASSVSPTPAEVAS